MTPGTMVQRAALPAMLAAALSGCGSNNPGGDVPAGTGGAAHGGATGTISAGGMTASGGSGLAGSSGSGGSVTPSAGGAGPAGGGASGGDGSGGVSAGGSGSGGSGGMTMAAGGAASDGGSSTGGAGGTPAQASEGCGKQGRPAGGTVTVANDHIYTFPDGYDGAKPFPLLMGFHACGNPIDQFLTLTKGSKFETDYVRAVPRSSDSGGCWNYGTDIARVTRVYDELMASYCIDRGKVFAAGHSSGAQMIVQILTHKSDAAHLNFKAVSPVAASDYGALSGPIPVLYIQGKNDSVRMSDGATAVARFRTANACGTTSTPYQAIMGCQSSGKTVSPGCVAYDGCQMPTIWCSHDDPQYGGTSHGVPCFGITAMHDFFGSLP